MKKKTYWIYMLYCANNTYYTGYTTDLVKRYQSHLNGKGGRYTRSFKPSTVAQSWLFICDQSTAMKIEYRIKQLSRHQKETLIETPALLFVLCQLPDDLIADLNNSGTGETAMT